MISKTEKQTIKSAYLTVYKAMNEKVISEKGKYNFSKKQLQQIDIFKNSVIAELIYNLDKEQLTE